MFCTNINGKHSFFIVYFSFYFFSQKKYDMNINTNQKMHRTTCILCQPFKILSGQFTCQFTGIDVLYDIKCMFWLSFSAQAFSNLG